MGQSHIAYKSKIEIVYNEFRRGTVRGGLGEVGDGGGAEKVFREEGEQS